MISCSSSRTRPFAESGSVRRTTSATTSAPVMGFFLLRTSDTRTFGWQLITASISSGWTFRPPTLTIPPLSADEIIAVTSQLDDIARIDEAVLVGEGLVLVAQVAHRGPRRADPKRAILDLHLHVSASPPDEARRETRETVADVEREAGLGRGEGMGDRGLWIEGSEMVQDCLVRDLAGQANVSRRDPVRRRAQRGHGANGMASRRYG